jgi:hypothetical protein
LLIISQNATNYDLVFPENTVMRINLAWCNSLNELENILKKHIQHRIFVDLPIGRIKPPNNKYTLSEMIPILQSYKNIHYFAVSNVEDENDLNEFLNIIPKNITIVPKIESIKGVKNIEKITNRLDYEMKYVMLDHDDLFSNIIRNNDDAELFQKYVKKLVDFCKYNSIGLLRTVGVVFSDDEERATQYVK